LTKNKICAVFTHNNIIFLKDTKMSWKYGSSSRVLALVVRSHEFTPQYCQKNKIKKNKNTCSSVSQFTPTVDHEEMKLNPW
jgi:hypothetical protein